MLDPLRRWSGIGEKPDYAGPLSYGGVPYTQDSSELGGADVVIVGAPTDALVSDRPGTRFAPRAIRAASCPPGPNLETGVDAFAELQVLDFGDARSSLRTPLAPTPPSRRPWGRSWLRVRSPWYSVATTRSPRQTRGPAPPSTDRWASFTSTPTLTLARKSSASKSRMGRSCVGLWRTAMWLRTVTLR
jgi:hypothetical protein